jgi:predicted DNA-binding protein
MVALGDNEISKMSTANIRVSAQGRETLRELARKEGRPMAAVLEKAIERYRRQKFLEEANASYARLKANPGKWKEETAERKLWDRTNADGMKDR